MLRLLAVLLSVVWASGPVKLINNGDAESEDKCRILLNSTFDDIKKKLHPDDLSKVIEHGHWELAGEIVALSHKQGADFSFPVRNAVKNVKNKADELIRSLNPKYNEKQKVVPVFRWAQNDGFIYLTIKYSVKWDGPGSVNVKDPKVELTDRAFKFTATGENSGLKYEYALDLDLFGFIDASASTWGAASVGRFTAIIAKQKGFKWPRLLLDKSKKGTGRLDLTRQDELDKEYGSSVGRVEFSELSCALSDKVYCPPPKDACRADCTQCKNRTETVTASEIKVLSSNNKPSAPKFCSALPVKGATSLTFTDKDLDKNKISGALEIHYDRWNEYDLQKFVVKVGKVPKSATIASTAAEGGPIGPTDLKDLEDYTEVDVNFREKVAIVELKNLPGPHPNMDTVTEEMVIAVFAKNRFGVLLDKPMFRGYADSFVPESGPQRADFTDTNAEKGKISGQISVEHHLHDESINEFVVYFGKMNRKDGSMKRLAELCTVWRNRSATPLPHMPSSTYSQTTITDRVVEKGATHLLVYARNSHGENDAFTSVFLLDGMAPCQKEGRPDCPPKSAMITIPDTHEEPNVLNMELELELHGVNGLPAGVELGIYLSTGGKCKGESNYRALDMAGDDGVATVGPLLKPGSVDEGAKTVKAKLLFDGLAINREGESWKFKWILFFTRNELGVSEKCVGVRFDDLGKAEEKEEL